MHRRPKDHNRSPRVLHIRPGTVTSLLTRPLRIGDAFIPAYVPYRAGHEAGPAFDPMKGRNRARIC
jgi:hypothetical protein